MLTPEQTRQRKAELIKGEKNRILKWLMIACTCTVDKGETEVSFPMKDLDTYTDISLEDVRLSLPYLNEKLAVYNWKIEENKDLTEMYKSRDTRLWAGKLIEL